MSHAARPATRLARAAPLLLAAAWACSPDLGDQEEIPRDLEDVPAAVQVTAARLAERLGGSTRDWYWDTESQDWECAFDGLSRQAELDVASDGRFAELELVYSLAEVEAVLPDVAASIRRRCRDEPGIVIELSLRREVLLDPLPELAEAWTQSGVVLEFQCPNGRDFEMDARHLVEEHPLDDVGEQQRGEDG